MKIQVKTSPIPTTNNVYIFELLLAMKEKGRKVYIVEISLSILLSFLMVYLKKVR